MRLIIIISFLLCRMLSLVAQENLSDSLLFYEYTYFKSTDTMGREQLLVKKLNLYLSRGKTGSEVFNEIKRIRPQLLQENKSAFLWNAAVIGYLNQETDRAAFYLSEYGREEGDSSIKYDLLSVLINKYADTTEANKRLKRLITRDSIFTGLKCFAEVGTYHRKHLNFYLISSAIVPGSGTMMNGGVAKGIVSLALAASSVYGIIKLVEYGLYLNAVLWGTGVGLKFYAGNIRLTERTFYQKEDRKKNKLATNCELKLQQVLNKYPLTLKEL